MAEVIGLATSIAGLITLTAQITGMSCKYISSVKQAPKEITELLVELGSLNRVLTALKDTADKNPHSLVLRKLNEELNDAGVGPLQGCLDALESLKSTLEKSSKNLLRRAVKRLKWPLKQAETQQYIQRIETQRNLFTTALSIDHLSLSTKTNAAVGKIESAVQNLQTEAEAEKVVRSGEKRLEKRDNVLRWLHSDDTDTKHAQVTSKRHKNTGEWIFARPEFRDFENPSSPTSKSRLLWGYGIPGAGKTFLSSLVIDHFLDRAESKNYGVAYVYFDFKERVKQTPIYTLSSLVKQLGSQLGSLSVELGGLHKKCTDERGRKTPTFEELYTVLQGMFRSFDQVFLVFDALDECHQSDQRTDLLKLFHRMGDDKANVFVTSRHHPEDIRESFSDVAKMELSAQEGDIATYIRQTIDDNPRAKRLIEQAKCQEQIISDLTESAHGMFLLVRFHIEYLCQQTTGRQIREALEKLKTSSTEEMPLDDTYNRAMETIRKQPIVRANLGINVLSWLVKSKRPLTADELRVAVSIEPKRYELDELDLLVDMTTLLDVCGGLAMLDKESNTVRLVHYTVQEYILKNSIIPDAELTLAIACTTFFSFDIFAQGPCLDGTSFKARVKSQPFLYYATPYLHHHLSACDENLLFSTVFELLRKPDSFFSYDQLYNCFSGMNFYYWYYRSRKSRTPLHFASSLGHLLVSQALLKKGADTSVQDSRGWTALHLAAEGGHDAVVKLLIDCGADISVQDYRRWTALHLAAEGGHDVVIKLLIDCGADISVKDEDRRTALHLAAEGDHDAVVKLLIDCGADISVQDEDEWTALHLAAGGGHDAVVKLLIDCGADISVQDEDRRTALHLAAEGDHDAVVKLLIDCGADISVQDEDRRTALHLAAEGGHDAVVKLFIDCGADISVKDEDEWTALHLAAGGGHDAVVKLLIDCGADISVQDEDRRTALHLAIKGGHDAVVKLLIDCGANILALTKNGDTPLDLTRKFYRSKVINILQAALNSQESNQATISTSASANP